MASFISRVLPSFIGCSCLALALFAGGCTETFTYANQSRSEGMELYEQKDYKNAAGAFRNATRQDPRDYRSHFYLGVCYEQLNQHQQAFGQYTAALEVMANTMEGKYDEKFRAMVLDTLASSVARFDQGEVELNSLEKRAQLSSKGEDWFLLAKTYRLKGDADRAIDAYKRAALFDVDSFDIRKEFGLYLLDQLGQTEPAAYWLRQAHRLNGADEAVNSGLARLGIVPLPARQQNAGRADDATDGTTARTPQDQ